MFRKILTIVFVCSLLFAQEVAVKNTSELKTAIINLKPGVTIIVYPGEYDLKGRAEISVAASVEKPIVIQAYKFGSVSFSGDSWFTFKNASYITLSGFNFISNDGPAVELLGCNNVRISENVFHLKETKQSSWIFIGDEKEAKINTSHHNRIDHNLFENKKLLGNFITLEGTMEPEYQISQHDIIDHNYFRNIGPRVENVLEAIRAGSSYVSMSSGFTLIEKNLFERCDGDPEVVSIKSSDDTVRYNTFRECLGVLSLRHGNRSTVDGNYFLGNGRSGEFLDNTGKKWFLGTGGVRFYGDNMKVINNYFEGLTGENWDASLALTNGNAMYGMGLPLTKHYVSRYSIIAFNTFVNNKSYIEVGYDGGGFQNNWWKIPPIEITLANNVVVGSAGILVNIMTKPINSIWIGNIVSSSGTTKIGNEFAEKEVALKKITMKRVGEIMQPTEKNILTGIALGSFPSIDKDINGNLRGKIKDPGCFQLSEKNNSYKPLTKNDVGPSWYKE